MQGTRSNIFELTYKVNYCAVNIVPILTHRMYYLLYSNRPPQGFEPISAVSEQSRYPVALFSWQWSAHRQAYLHPLRTCLLYKLEIPGFGTSGVSWREIWNQILDRQNQSDQRSRLIGVASMRQEEAIASSWIFRLTMVLPVVLQARSLEQKNQISTDYTTCWFSFSKDVAYY